MSRISIVTISVILSLLAIAIPLMTAIKLAEMQSLEEQTDRMRMLSADIIRRGDVTGRQVVEATAELIKNRANNPCSENNQKLMRSLAIKGTYLLGMGYEENNRLMCSTLGSHGEGVPLGKPYLNSRSGRVWTDVTLPFAPGKRFVIASNQGYATIINRDLTIDVISPSQNVSLATLYLPSKHVTASRKVVKQEWVEHYDGQDELTFQDGEYLVVIQRSKLFNYAALAAVPDPHIKLAEQRFIKVLVPMGLLLSCMMVTVILFLSKRRLSLKAELQTALNRNEFFLVYQPVIDLSTGRCSGAEALIRWRRADGTIIPPDSFIPVAESAGLIQPITDKVLAIIERDVPKLLERCPQCHIGINLSCDDLLSERIVGLFSKLLARSGIPAGNLMVEATERGFVDTEKARMIVQQLRDLGLNVAIDDFGTGYSSLSRLASFNLNYLKIDKLFVDAVGTEAPTRYVAMHIINMSKSLGLEMVAEGVESEAQVEFLHEQGVRYAQGWLFAKAMPIEELANYIESQAERESVWPIE